MTHSSGGPLCAYTYTHIYTYKCEWRWCEALIIELFCRKWHIKIRHSYVIYTYKCEWPSIFHGRRGPSDASMNVTHMNESFIRPYEHVTHRNNASMNVRRSLIHMCDMTHSYVRHDASMNMWHIRMMPLWTTHSYVSHEASMNDSFWWVTPVWTTHSNESCRTYEWRLYECTTETHSHVRHDSFVRATRRLYEHVTHEWRLYERLIHMCDMTHSYVRHDVSMNMCRHIRMTPLWTTHSYASMNDSFIRLYEWLIHTSLWTCDTYERRLYERLIHMCHMTSVRMTHSDEWRRYERLIRMSHVAHTSDASMNDSFICVTWRLYESLIPPQWRLYQLIDRLILPWRLYERLVHREWPILPWRLYELLILPQWRSLWMIHS